MDDNSVAISGASGTVLVPSNSAVVSNSENSARALEREEPPISPSSTDALARFEFEAGRGNEGSKILMVEWDCAHPDGHGISAQDRKGWVVSWENKSAAYPLDDNDSDKGTPSTLRVYFLLPENAPIPPAVTISHSPTGRMLTTKCLPAIFAPGLGVSPPDAGKRGVLHTIWARRRMVQLQDEIKNELQTNSEGVALEMAVQEKQWVIEHFGLVDLDTRQRPAPPPTPRSPRSPVGGRLGEMLRGLHVLHTVSAPKLSTPKPGSAAAVASLDAVISDSQPVAPVSQTKETEDELFALPMSPRSPEMKTSPFSFLK
ncbi:hypothetical protein F5Y14DRAFT_332757 [Nemania sp. NC0429]|nr:hypothetical protein F5Y14DRAFT_332757 [Nemania sp. NC0429]